MAFSTTSRSFTNLGSAAATDLNRNNSSSTLASTLGNGAGPWGNNASSIWGNGTKNSTSSSRAAPKDSVQPRELNPNASADSLDLSDVKKGSGSLLSSSESEQWKYPQTRGDSAIRLNTQPIRTSTKVDAPKSMSNGSQTISPIATRPPPINLTTTQTRPSFTPSYSAGGFPSDPPHVYPKYKDRQHPQAYPLADSAISPNSVTTSPMSERRPQWTPTYRDSTSVSSSRDPSRPPTSSHSDRPPSLPYGELSRPAQRQTSLSTRNPSVSSQRNGSLGYLSSNNTDYLNAPFSQLNVSNDGRPPSRAYPSTLQPVPNGLSRDVRIDSAGHNSSVSLPFSGSDTLHDLQMNGVPLLNHGSMMASRLRDSNGLDFKPGQPYTGEDFRSRSIDFIPITRPSSAWQESSDAALTLARRSPAYTDHQHAIDPRLAAQIMALKNPYSVCNPYSLPGSLSLNTVSPYLGYYPMGLGGLDTAMPSRDFVTDGVQSAKLYEFKIAGKNNRRYELKDIYDHVAEFAGDQHGSRFIQTKLETANSDEKERVFREIEPNAIPLMTDVFGNYVIQKFFDHGHQEHKKILANKMRGQVLNLSTQMYGCRVVQKALEHVLIEQQAALVGELENHILKCVKDQNGNHVIQKAIELCPADNISFVYQAFVGQVQTLSLHPYGCRVIQRCLERQEWFPAKRAILTELHDTMPKGMICDQYGNYVVQHVVEKASAADRQYVLNIIMSDLEGFSKHKFASNVVEKCIQFADDAWRRRVVDILVANDHRRLDGESALVVLIKDSFGNYVIQKLLDWLSHQDYLLFHQHLQPAMTHAKRTGSGKQVLSIEKKMHRFPFQAQQPQQQRNSSLQLSLPSTAFANSYGSVANTPPSLTADSHSLQSSGIPSVNGDTVEGAPSMSRKGSEPTADCTLLR